LGYEDENVMMMSDLMWEEDLDHHPPHRRKRIMARRRLNAGWDLEGLWEALFPMLVTTESSDLAVIVVDSNAKSRHLATNAFGVLGSRQRLALEQMLALRRHQPTVVALHHHVGMPVFAHGLLERIKERGLVMIDGRAFADTVLRHGPIVVFNGHRHQRYIQRLGSIHVVAAPSTTLGDGLASVAACGYGEYTVGWLESGAMHLASEDWQAVNRSSEVEG